MPVILSIVSKLSKVYFSASFYRLSKCIDFLQQWFYAVKNKDEICLMLLILKALNNHALFCLG